MRHSRDGCRVYLCWSDGSVIADVTDWPLSKINNYCQQLELDDYILVGDV